LRGEGDGDSIAVSSKLDFYHAFARRARMPSKRIAVVVALFCACACGSGKSLPVQPQIDVSPAGLYFGSDLCLAVYINTSPENDLQIENEGQDPLTLTSVSMGSSDVFQLAGPNMILPDGGTQSGVPMTLQSQQRAFLRVIFSPTAVVKYTDTITIVSNAQNSPTLTVPVRGVGAADPSDGGYENSGADAGISPDCTGDGGQTS
jgi:hypothetical protein